MKQITITQEGAMLKFEANEGIILPDLLEMVLNTIRTAAHQTLESCPEEQKEDIRADIYDMINRGISHILNEISPPDTDLELTEAAILLAQNAIIEEATARQVPISQIYKEMNEKAAALVDDLKQNNARAMS